MHFRASSLQRTLKQQGYLVSFIYLKHFMTTQRKREVLSEDTERRERESRPLCFSESIPLLEMVTKLTYFFSILSLPTHFSDGSIGNRTLK